MYNSSLSTMDYLKITLDTKGSDPNSLGDEDEVKNTKAKDNANLRPRRQTSKIAVSVDHIDSKPYKRKKKRLRCVKCRKVKLFSTQKQLDRHEITHSKKSLNVIICEICSAQLKSEVYYKRHLAARHPDEPKIYICDHDGRSFAAKDYLRIHMDRHRVHQILTCHTCTKSYISKHTFRRHLKMHIEKHVCSICGLVFSHKTLLDNHCTSKHSDDLPFQCSFCTRFFPNKTARNNHQYTAHKDNKEQFNFKCKECNIYFDMKEELRIHSFIHFDGEIKTCLKCDQIFKTNRLLKIHMQKHETQKSFQCTSCGDFFTFKTGLAKHIRLNRCRGSEINVNVNEEDNSSSIAEIAKKQLLEITMKPQKTKKPEVNVMEDVTDESETKSELEDDFNNFFKTECEIITEEIQIKKEKIEETLKTRWMRKKKNFDEESKKPRLGRAHLIYTCDHCGQSIKYKKAMINHMRQHITHQKYACRECQEAFRSRKKLIEHSLTLHGIKLVVLKNEFSCETCDKRFDGRSVFEAHRLSHDESARSHVCSICSAAFKSVGNLHRHQAIHAPTKDFHCSNCQKSFKTKIALKVHNEAVHAVLKVFVNCTICKVIIQEKNLKSHIKNQHTEEGQERPFSCTICNKTFRAEKHGQRHYESVHDPKNKGVVYQCADCPAQFYRQRELKEHWFVHYTGFIFQCETCLKMFKTKRLLMAHSAVHNEVAGNFPCDICPGVTFKSRGGRRKHMMRLHSQRTCKNYFGDEPTFSEDNDNKTTAVS